MQRVRIFCAVVQGANDANDGFGVGVPIEDREGRGTVMLAGTLTFPVSMQ